MREVLASVLERTAHAVVAEVRAVSAPRRERFHDSIELTAVVLRVVFGEIDVGGTVCVQYAEGRPHVRGHTTISPRVTGSGAELRVRPGDEVVLLLADASTLLRVEPTDNLAAIERGGA